MARPTAADGTERSSRPNRFWGAADGDIIRPERRIIVQALEVTGSAISPNSFDLVVCHSAGTVSGGADPEIFVYHVAGGGLLVLERGLHAR